LNRMHRINIGGTEITRQFATLQEIDFEAAEMQKIQLTKGDPAYGSLKGIYSKVYGRALREFKQVIDHHVSDTGAEVPVIQLCGGASLYAGLGRMIQDATHIPVEHINPFDNVAYPAFMEDAMHEIGPSFVPALGAAMRHFE